MANHMRYRHELGEQEWLWMGPLLDGVAGQVGTHGKDNRHLLMSLFDEKKP